MINYYIQQADDWQILFDKMQPWFKERAIVIPTWLLHEQQLGLYYALHEGLDIL